MLATGRPDDRARRRGQPDRFALRVAHDRARGLALLRADLVDRHGGIADRSARTPVDPGDVPGPDDDRCRGRDRRGSRRGAGRWRAGERDPGGLDLGRAAERAPARQERRTDHDGDDGDPRQRPDREPRRRPRRGAIGSPVAQPGLAFDRGGGPRPQVARRIERQIAEHAEGRLVGRVRIGDSAARGARAEVLIQPGRLGEPERAVQSLGGERAGAVVGRSPVVGPAAHPCEAAHRSVLRPDAASRAASSEASVARSAASAWRRLSRARVRSARAAT